ncbi:MAG: TolC family protein [Phycisphaerales bacterium]|jgi:outer membrane protein TolC|nr:TolC family protein [Phycisphaerales bacterium]
MVEWGLVTGSVRIAMCAGCAMVLVAGCENPFHTSDRDRAPSLDRTKLGEIDHLSLGEGRPLPDVEQSRDTGATLERLRERVREIGTEGNRVPLTLEECRAAVLENNLDLRVVLVDPALAQERVSQEEAAWEATFTTRAFWNENDSATSSDLEDGRSRFNGIEPGVRVPLRTGGTATVSLPFQRSETSNQFATLNPAYTSDLAFSISQPLLRGAGRRATMAPLKIAGYEAQAAGARAKLEAIRQVAAVDRAYWRVYGARQALDVRQQELELAQAQLDQAERLVNAGSVAHIEVLRAQSGVADRLEGVLVAHNDLLREERTLKRIVNVPGLGQETRAGIDIASAPDPVIYDLDREALVSDATDRRMELLELELQIAADESRIGLARNRALPLFSLDYTYRINGLGENLSSAMRQMYDNNFEDWAVGLNVEVPIGNDRAESVVREAILARVQRLSTRAAREAAIRQEVLDASDQLETTWQRILAARQSVILNARTFEAEQNEFRAGTRTSTDVLDAQARLSGSQLAEIRALVEYQIAQVDLAFATGTLLGAARIEFETPTYDQLVEESRELPGYTPLDAEPKPLRDGL